MIAGRALVYLAFAGISFSRSRPDVFLITIDTLRADHVHCYGYANIQTPALDALARDGIRFSCAFTPSPITNASHASILTGLLPSIHGVTDFGDALSNSHRTLAQSLKDEGYQTAAFIGSVILDSKSLAPGFDRGFDFYDNFPAQSQTSARTLERRGIDVVQHAESWLRSHPRGPHFVWLHLYDPHDPYKPPPPFPQTYDGEVAYADSAVLHFVRYLRQTERYSGSLIVVTGDHGEGLGDHHEDTHGIFLYDSTTHVPLLFKQPTGTQAGRVVDGQVRTTDILPTVLDLLGISIPEKLDGHSLRLYLDGSEMADRVALGETDYPLSFGWAALRSVRTAHSLFVEAPRPELYNLKVDSQALQNVYEPWNPAVIRFREALSELRGRSPAHPRSAASVGSSTMAELRALGYFGRADVGSVTNVPEPSLLPDPKDKIEEHNQLHRALEATADHRLKDAREALETLIKRNPNSFLALRQLADLEIADGHYNRAIDYLKRTRILHPVDAPGAFAEGRALAGLRDLPAASDALKTSLELMPGQFEPRLLLGKIYLELNDLAAAEDQLQAAILLRPGSTAAMVWLARVYIAEGHNAEAITVLRQALAADPRDAEARATLRLTYRRVNKQE